MKAISIIILIIIFTVISYLFMKDSFQEPFTPGLKKLYRPYIRRSRVYMTNTYNNFIKKSRILLTKAGVL